MNVTKLYPQYITLKDRRNSTTPVSFERRSGVERRTPDRVNMDTKLTKDVFEIKNKVSDMKNTSFGQKIVDMISKIPSFASNPQVLTPQKLDNIEKAAKVTPSLSTSTAAAGAAAGILAGALCLAFIGPFAGIAGLGFGAYFGSKLFKHAVVSHLKNE